VIESLQIFTIFTVFIIIYFKKIKKILLSQKEKQDFLNTKNSLQFPYLGDIVKKGGRFFVFVKNII